MHLNLSLQSTPDTVLSNDAWFGFLAVTIALLCWSFEKPETAKGKHLILPLECISLTISGLGALCFFLNHLRFGKFIVLIECFLLFLLPIGVFILFLLSHIFDFSVIRQGRIHEGIGQPGVDYFDRPKVD